MPKIRFCFLIFILTIYQSIAQASITGQWVTVDDKTNKKRAILNIKDSGKTISAYIVKVYSQPGDTGICSKCPGSLKNKPVKGLRILWDMKQTSKTKWQAGKILDPKTGKIYNAKISQEGNKLYVRGYLGFSLLGRTQVWYR